MTSERQIAANRANGAKSRGPKTQAGKNAVRYNALRHGFLAEATILPSEDPDELEELVRRLDEEIRPCSELESLLVDRIASCAWRLRRVIRVEAGILAAEEYNELAARAYAQSEVFVEYPILTSPLAEEAKGTIIDRDRWGEMVAKGAERELAGRHDDDTVTGAAYIRDANGADALSKLSRYEASIERNLYKAINELRRLRDQPLLEVPDRRQEPMVAR